MSMPGKQARVLCPVCAEPMPPDETECENCGAFVIDEAVVRLSRALGLDRDKALKLFEAGFRHPKQLRDRDPDRVLEEGEVGLLFICTSCGSFVAAGDMKCPRCAAEFETEPAEATPEEEDILDIVLCPVCGADNDPELAECEICGEPLKETREPQRTGAPEERGVTPVEEAVPSGEPTDRADDFPIQSEPPIAAPRPETPRPAFLGTLDARPMPTPEPTPTSLKPSVSAPSEPKAPSRRATPETPPYRGPAASTSTIPRSEAAERARVPPPGRAPALELVREPSSIAVRDVTAGSARAKRLRAIAPSGLLRRRRPRFPRTRVGISADLAGGLVLAAAASLLLAGALNQGLVSAGIAVFLVGLSAYVAVGYFRGGGARPSQLDAGFLGAAAVLGLSVPLLHAGSIDPTAAVGLSLADAFVFAWATRRLLRGPQGVLLALGSGIPIIGYGLAMALDPAYAMTLAWFIGILAAVPWPGAVAASEVLRRKSATVLRGQLVRAERNIQRKDYEQSLAEYDRAITTARKGVPGAEIPWYGKGATLILLGRYDDALRAIDTALDINPQNEVAWVNKGNAFTKLGRLGDALRCFNAAIQVHPTYEVAWNNKGNALARLGKFDEALHCYERALEIDDRYRGAWVNKGFVLTKLGRFDEAASCADQALRLEPGRRAEPI